MDLWEIVTVDLWGYKKVRQALRYCEGLNVQVWEVRVYVFDSKKANINVERTIPLSINQHYPTNPATIWSFSSFVYDIIGTIWNTKNCMM